jgi:hypothetical protein
MPMIVETDTSLEIQDKMPSILRVVFLLLSLFPLLAPYELLILPEWQSYFNPIFFFVALISVGALAVSGFLVWAAVAGINRLLRLDRRQNEFSYYWDAPIVPVRKYACPISSIRAVDIETNEWSDGSPSYSLKIATVDGGEFASGSTWSRSEIEQAKARVTAFLNESLMA